MLSLVGTFGYLAVSRLVVAEWLPAIGLAGVIAALAAALPYAGIVGGAAVILGIGAILLHGLAAR